MNERARESFVFGYDPTSGAPIVDVFDFERVLRNPAARRVARDVVEGWRVSTVHLIVDHNFTSDGPPILWETMVFPENGGASNGATWAGFTRRYRSRDDALAGHREIVAAILAGMTP